jgi:hypothetical protein
MEVLLFLSCLSNKGCEQSRQAFLKQSVEAVETLKYSEQRLKLYIPPNYAAYFGPTLNYLMGNNIDLKITDNLKMEVSKNGQKFIYTTTF